MERLVELEKMSFDDTSTEVTLRPSIWDDYIGQEKIKKNLQVFIKACKKREEVLDHILLFGPPGLGKTTLSHIIANQMETNIKVTAAPTIEKGGDLAAILTNLEEGDILFIDEIHRLSPAIEEILYPAMEDFRLDIIIGSGPAAQTVQIDLPKFTLIGATTRAGMLSNPLRDRFGMHFRLNFYNDNELSKIVSLASIKLDKNSSTESSFEIARRSRGTPRIANNLLRRTRDFAEVKGDGTITLEIAKIALEALEVDNNGLDEMDIRILRTIVEKFKGGPVGLSTIATAVSEEKDTIEEVYEPFLIKEGYLKRTARGRQATELAYKHLGVIPSHKNMDLFSGE